MRRDRLGFFEANTFQCIVVFFFHVRRGASLPAQPYFGCATAAAWNFGLCATKSREPRQARKGATVPGSLRAPRSTRSSSHLRAEVFSVVLREPLRTLC